jgi:3-deoxy-manno-octulosonate cytidylyltransferase (CMP-KDO synthetase)
MGVESSGFVVAIPARYGASRLPGKPLRLLGGLPLVVHVARRALAAGAAGVVVATDDARIASALENEPVTVCMTRADHVSGTDRLAECAEQLAWPDDLRVINLQGDEPFAPAEGIAHLAHTLAQHDAPMATLAEPLTDPEALFDSHVVKLVCDSQGRALYFSRAPVPWWRDRFDQDRISTLADGWLRHIGIYGYRAGFLRQFAALPEGRLERIESLEQLRVLEAGLTIQVAITPSAFPPGVDTEDDLIRAEAWLERGQ